MPSFLRGPSHQNRGPSPKLDQVVGTQFHGRIKDNLATDPKAFHARDALHSVRCSLFQTKASLNDSTQYLGHSREKGFEGLVKMALLRQHCSQSKRSTSDFLWFFLDRKALTRPRDGDSPLSAVEAGWPPHELQDQRDEGQWA